MIKLGITGGIGSGKTTVCKFFENLSIPVYYSDEKAKYLMTTNENLKLKIIQAFGPNSYLAERLNTSYLSETVFHDENKLKTLNNLVHPIVIEDFLNWCDLQKAPYVILESAIIIESGLKDMFNYLLCVTTAEEEKIRRITQRDKISPEQVLLRMKNQIPDEEKIKMADFVVVSGNLERIRNEVLKIHQQIIQGIE